MRAMRELNLDILKEGLPGITRATGIYLHEAMLVALTKNGHRSGVRLKVEGEYEIELSLIWKEDVGKAILNIWKNERDAANYGAVGIALSLMTELSKFISFELGDIGSGIDYWMSSKKLNNDTSRLVKREARLEISGIFKETSSNSLKMRVNLKKKQMTASDASGLPGWAAVIEFSAPKSKIEKK